MKRMWSKNELKEVAKGTQKDITTLVDSQGHERFIEGDITITKEGITQSYGKWSLSGSHLMIVIAGSLAADFADTYYDTPIPLPQWIIDKLVKISPDTTIVVNSTYQQFASNGTPLSKQALLRKTSDTAIETRLFIERPTDYPYFRCIFDVLIDND